METTADSSLVPQLPIHSSGGERKRRRRSNCCCGGGGGGGGGGDGGDGGCGVLLAIFSEEQIFMLRLVLPSCSLRKFF